MCRRADLVRGGRCPGGVETSSRLDRHDRRPSQGKRQRPTHRAIECALIVAEMAPKPASATFCAHSVGGTAPWPAGSPTSPTSTSTGPGERRQPETHPQPAPLAHRPDQCRQPHPDRRGSLPDDVRRAPSQDPHRRCALSLAQVRAPARVKLVLDRPRSATPIPARATQIRSLKRREPITARLSGPRNSMVTAMPKGIRAKDW